MLAFLIAGKIAGHIPAQIANHIADQIAARPGIFAEGRFLGKVADEWANDAQEFVRAKLPHLIVVAIIALLLARLLRLITNHLIRVAEQHAASTGRVGQLKTLSGVIRTTGLAIIGVITGLQFLEALGVNLAPLLASAGVAGIAIGLAAQNIVKDMLNGILILIEDQFNVGDTVRLAGLAGTVEAMTLRKTTVRDGDGTLYVIPNSQITTVANQSVGFSVATMNVSVDFSANPDEVVALLKSIAMGIRNSDAFRQVFVEDPQVLGVDSVKGSEIIFPVVFKTLATKQYGPMREFRRQVRLALQEHHMLPGDPNRVFRTFEEDTESADENSARTAHPEEKAAQDPTTIKPHEAGLFGGE
jgi:small conductance mechanosensitive channel